MTTTFNFNFGFKKPVWYLVIGILTLFTSHVTFGVAITAWIASVPFLLYLSKTSGAKSRLLFALSFIIAWTLAIGKIITDPIPMVLAVFYAAPIGLIQLMGYLTWSVFRASRFRVWVFPAAMVIFEWVQYTFTPLASWGAVAYTQVDVPTIVQTVSIFGMAGLSFLIYWFNASVAEVILNKNYKTMIPVSGVVMICLVWGDLRLDASRSSSEETMMVAAVGTDSEIGGLPLPDEARNKSDIRGVFDRTRQAASYGAQLVVWNEAAFLLHPEEENAWKDSIRKLAEDYQVNLVASYVVPFTEDGFHYENKYLMVAADGSVDHEYLKHEPVPAEPAEKGSAPQQVMEVGGVNIGGAICYDYDFPYVARNNKNAGADVVGLPSSDWRGIDPIHTQMAAFRAVEQGNSIVRSTRFGLSAAITPYGTMSAQMSSFDEHGKLMMASVPSISVVTVYSIIGDLFVWICITALMVMFIGKIYRRRNGAKEVENVEIKK